MEVSGSKSEECYLNKFKNRGRCYNNKGQRRYEGNVMNSQSVHCPGSLSARIEQKKFNFETERMHVVDFQQILVVRQYRKNIIPSLVKNITTPQCNPQTIYPEVPLSKQGYVGHQPTSVSKKKILKPSPESRLIHLPQIKDKLYLGNGEILKHPKLISNIKIIINLTDDEISRNLKCKMINIKYEDRLSLNFHTFKSIIDQTNDIISNTDDEILIVCDKGVNRSVSIILAYAIMMKEYTFVDAIDYLDTVKLNKYPNWNSLTNTRIKSMLKLLKPE
jgi:protein-tyrosine phosphatase